MNPETRWAGDGNAALNLKCRCGTVYDYDNHNGTNTGTRTDKNFVYLYPKCPNCGEPYTKEESTVLGWFSRRQKSQNGSALYKTPNGRRVEVTEVTRDDISRDKAPNDSFSDAVCIGEVAKFIDKIHGRDHCDIRCKVMDCAFHSETGLTCGVPSMCEIEKDCHCSGAYVGERVKCVVE